MSAMDVSIRHRVLLPRLAAAALRHLRMHDLRHPDASLRRAAGKELHDIPQQLGHHSPAFTLAVDGPVRPRARRNDVHCLDEPPAR